jgi:predicted dehydrogenase
MKTAAIIGCGRPKQGKVGWAQGHAQARGLLEAYPEVQLHGVDIDEEHLKLFGETFNLPESQLHLSTDALYDTLIPDAVGIATWPALHCAQVHDAAWKGVRGILCEKPLAIDTGEIERILDVCQNRGVKMAVAHQRRHEPKFRLARQLIQEGRFGEKTVLHARVGDDWDILSWTVHWFDMANFFFGEHPRTILGGAHFDGEERYRHAVESNSVIFAEYSGDRQAIFTTGPTPLVDFGFMIEGDKAFGRFVEEGLRLFTEQGSELVPHPEEEMSAYGHVFKELGQAMEDGSPMVCDAADCAWATRMAFAAHESAVYQRKVSLPSRVKYPPLEILRHPPEHPKTGRKVTLLADNHHRDPDTGLSTRDGVISALEKLGDTVNLVDVTQRAVTRADLAEAELLLICHTQFESSEDTRQIVGDWMNGGRPTVIVHCGIGAWPDWQELRERTGFYWVWPENLVPADAGKQPSGHPFVPCNIEVLDPDRLPTGWTRAWLPVDEVYRDLAEGDPVDLLAVTDLQGSRRPIAWQNRQHPHITAWLPGHRPDVWELPVMRDGLGAICDLALKSSKVTA